MRCDKHVEFPTDNEDIVVELICELPKDHEGSCQAIGKDGWGDLYLFRWERIKK